MENQKCPYCKNDLDMCIPDVVYRNAESYGGGQVRFNCLQCNKVIEGFTKVTISIGGIRKTDRESMWSHWSRG